MPAPLSPPATIRSRDEMSPEYLATLTKMLRSQAYRELAAAVVFAEAIAREDWEATSQLVQRARDVNADQAHGLIFQGRDELVRAEFEQAVGTLNEATTYIRHSSAVWRLVGVAHEELGNYSEAKRAYEEAYRCNPNDWVALRRYARLLVQMDEKVRAQIGRAHV